MRFASRVLARIINQVIGGDPESSSGQATSNGEIQKLQRVMRLTAIILLIACLAANAKGFTQTLTLNVKDAPLEKVFAEIKKQTGYSFVYASDLSQKAKKVTLQLKDVSIEEALKECFKQQPFTYKIINKVVIVNVEEKQGSPNADATNVEIPPTIDVSGKVTDSDNNPLIGASVKVKGTTRGTTTNKDGVFNLKGIDQDAVLEISYIGYEAITVAVKNKSSIVLSLKRTESKLDEMQVIAYGTTSKRLQTGNVTTVKAEDIAKQPVNNPLLALEGRVPGLQIEQATGFAGSGVKVRIQGENSIAGGNDPLYVVDGVPYISQLLPEISTTLGTSGGRLVNSGGQNFGTFGNPLNFINPMDIESIEVLKDADATAIYGSRAANGAVLITTKKGKAGEQRIDVNVQQGWGKVTRKMDMLSLRQFLDMRYEALRNNNIDLNTASATAGGGAGYYDLKVWDTTRYTNWQKELVGNTAHYTDIQAAISGGTSNNSYVIGGGYHRETTVLPADFNDQKASMHFQVNSNSSNQKFRVQFSANYMIDINKLPLNVDGGDITRMAYQLAPNAPSLYTPDGSINWAPDANGKSTWDYTDNPAAQLLNKYQNKTNNLVSNILLSYQVIPGLKLKSSFGYTNLQTKETAINPLASYAPDIRSVKTRVGIYGNGDVTSWVMEPQITYEKIISKGRLETLIGASFQERSSEEQMFHGYGYATDDVINDIHAASSVVPDPSIQFTYKYEGFFGRIKYTWGQKYIVDITGRRDGSSRFGPANRFHNFGSVGGAWIFSDEKWIQSILPFLSFGKLKASYGTTGNDQIGEYQYLSTYTFNSVGVPYQNITALQSSGLANPYLQWEETKKISAGLDIGFENDRILINATYYHNQSSNQLLGYKLPITTGFNTITQNFPATVENTGLELTINTTNVQKRQLTWSSSFNLTLPKNKLAAFPGLEQSSYGNYLVIGQPVSVIKKFHFIGVDPATGLYYFDSKTNPFNPKFPEDATALINPTPKFYGGLQNSFSYKRVQLDVFLQYVKQIGIDYFYGRFPGLSRVNQPTYVLNRWQKIGDLATHQKFDANFSFSNGWFNVMDSDAPYADASYIRMKNISLSWQMPESLLKSMRLHELRIYMRAQNLFTLTKYKGLDPETLSSTSLPPLRVLTVGAQLSL